MRSPVCPVCKRSNNIMFISASVREEELDDMSDQDDVEREREREKGSKSDDIVAT